MINFSFTVDFFSQFRKVLEEVPEQVAFQHLTRTGRETITYAEVGREVRLMSRHLADQGIGPGTKVGLILENHPRWGIAFLAAQSAGAVLVPLDVLHSPQTLARLIEHSECRLLFVSESQQESFKEIQQSLASPLPAIIVGRSQLQENWEWDRILEAQVDSDIPIPLRERDLDEPHIIMYTSGTTGDPKGVVLSGRSLYKNVSELLKQIEVGPDDHFLGVLPLYHILALIVNFIAPLYRGARTTFIDVLDVQRILKAFREEGITIFVCVPQFFYLLHNRIVAELKKQGKMKLLLIRSLSRVSRFCGEVLNFNLGRRVFRKIHRPFGEAFRFFGVGGARFDPEVAQQLTDLGFRIIQAYGMTETAAVATVAPVKPIGIGSVGRPLPHVEIKIDEPDEKGVGEVLIRGENVMKEYFRNPAATREAIDSEGWLHSGDLGYLSRGNFLHITGRAKDVIVLSSGKNIYPEEIEHFFQSNCPLIQEMCVIGLEDESEHERLHAVVVPDFDRLKQEQVVNAYNMIRYLTETLSQQLPPHKRIKSLEIWREPLPRTTTRKIRRFELQSRLSKRKQEDKGLQEDDWQPADPIELRLKKLVHQLKPSAVVRPDKSLELDLGFDSLERVEFLSTVEESFGIRVDEEEGANLLHLSDVIDVVRDRLQDLSEGEESRRSWSEILDKPLSQEDQVETDHRLRRRPFVELLTIIVARAVWLGARLLFRVTGEGVENLPTRYPFMICPNHLSFLDAFLVTSLLPNRIIRRFFSLGYSEYFSSGLKAFLAGLVKLLPVNPDRNLRHTLRVAVEGLRKDLVLLVFPEGERSIDGSLKVFRKGPAILATKIRVPVVPVGIRGSFEAWPRGSNRVRLHPIRVRFGNPVTPTDDESVEQFNNRLKEAVRELL